MAFPRNRLAATVAAVTWAALLASPGLTQEAELQGVILSAEAGSILLRTEAGERAISITPSTKIEAVSGAFNASRSRKPPTVLISGLPVKVEVHQSGNGMVADEIEYKAKDYQTAVQIQAGVHDTAKATREVREAVAQTGEFEVKAETQVFFPVGSAVLSPKGKRDLLNLAAEARKHQGYLISVLGYADPTGNAAANERLSNRRAQGVINYLKQNGGLQPGRVLAASAMGEVSLTGAGPEPTSAAGLRRVTARVVVSKVQISQP